MEQNFKLNVHCGCSVCEKFSSWLILSYDANGYTYRCQHPTAATEALALKSLCQDCVAISSGAQLDTTCSSSINLRYLAATPNVSPSSPIVPAPTANEYKDCAVQTYK